jgi:D-aspartate ligase
VGFSNFDIKYDTRDGKFKAFEINTRQGRSNYYVSSTGNNIARYVTEDFVLGEDLGECVYNSKEIYWRYVPDSVVSKYVSMELRTKIKELKKGKKAYSSLRYGYDLKLNVKRSLFVFLHEKHHIGKFRMYYKP